MIKNYLKNFTLKDYIYIGLITILIVATISSIVSSRMIRNDVDMTRQMLDARARIQIIHFTALSEGRTLTEQEKQKVRRLWHQAEYSKVQVKPTDK
ncbi:MAG: hypothetical protein ACR2MD_03200 [Aridibacter sp.]